MDQSGAYQQGYRNGRTDYHLGLRLTHDGRNDYAIDYAMGYNNGWIDASNHGNYITN